MTRRLSVILFIVWVLSMTALVALWAQSFYSQEVFPSVFSHPGVKIGSYRGRVIFALVRPIGKMPAPLRLKISAVGMTWSAPNSSPGAHMDEMSLVIAQAEVLNGFGFGKSWGTISTSMAVAPHVSVIVGGLRVDVIAVPDWVLFLICTVVVAVARIPENRRQRRADRGLCRRCGYDLRATPTRCPECGTENRYNAPALTETP